MVLWRRGVLTATFPSALLLVSCHQAKKPICQLQIRQIQPVHVLSILSVVLYRFWLKHVANGNVTNVFIKPIQVDWFPREQRQLSCFILTGVNQLNHNHAIRFGSVSNWKVGVLWLGCLHDAFLFAEKGVDMWEWAGKIINLCALKQTDTWGFSTSMNPEPG